MKEVMQDCLNGMFWDVGTLSFDIPYIGDGVCVDFCV